MSNRRNQRHPGEWAFWILLGILTGFVIFLALGGYARITD